MITSIDRRHLRNLLEYIAENVTLKRLFEDVKTADISIAQIYVECRTPRLEQ